MRGKDARVLYGARLGVERVVFLDCEVPEKGPERPFHYDPV